MNYQIKNSIIIIFFIYVLSFYQINCDNNTINSNSSSISSNNNSKTTGKPAIIGNEEEETQKSKSVKKAEPKFVEYLYNISKSDETNPVGAKSRKHPELLDVNNTNIPSYSENDMALSTQKPFIITNTTISSGEVVEANKKNVSTVTVKPVNSTMMPTTATTTTTTKPNITTTTTIPKTQKPLITVPSDELPEPAAKPLDTKPVQPSSNTTINNGVTLNSTTPTNITSLNSTATAATLHSVEGLDLPNVQFSKEPIPTITSKRDYIIPVVALIFAIPIILAIATIMYRRAKDYWETRHYRRMDFLIDEMYND